ncbi:MAG TPA: TIR domain-containing protein [Rhizomicrobium sp.]|jgi:uncharacterized protein YecT (DUF1311 family)
MSKKVFLSHSSKDHKTASAICAALEARGHACWMSSRDVMPGENFQGAIVRAIREAGVMVLVFSANANNSDEIKKEMALASQVRMMVIPVRAEDVLPSEDFTYELATRQWIDMFTDWEQAIEKLSRQISVAIPKEESAAPAFGARAPAPSAKSRQLMFAGIALVLLGGSAAAYWLMRPVPRQPPLPIERQQPVRQPSAMDTARLEDDLWDSVKGSGDAAVVRSYLAKYPGGTFAAAAKARLAELDKAAQIPTAKPSFPCEGVSNTAQRLICTDRALAALDVETASLYRRARENAVDTAPLADEQSAWLLRRDHCGSVECIRASYAERRAEIGRWLGGEQ